MRVGSNKIGLCVMAAGLTLLGVALAVLLQPTTPPILPAPANVEPTASPTHFTLELPPRLCGSDDTLSVEVPITNPFEDTVEFSTPHCNCTCTASRGHLTKLEAGAKATLPLQIRTAGKAGVQHFSCRWVDQHDREWQAMATLTLCTALHFEPPVLDLGALKPNTEHTVKLALLQHWHKGEPEPALPRLSGATIAIGTSTTQPLGEELMQRRTAISLTINTGDAMGPSEQKLLAMLDGVEPASVFVRWQLPAPVSASPSRLLLLPTEQETKAWLTWSLAASAKNTTVQVDHPALQATVTGNLLQVKRVQPITETVLAEVTLITTTPEPITLRIPVVLQPDQPNNGNTKTGAGS